MSLVLNNNKLILITNKEPGTNLDLTFLRDVGYIIFVLLFVAGKEQVTSEFPGVDVIKKMLRS